MSKKLRLEPIYIAPQIFGWLDQDNNPNVHDELTGIDLDPRNINDKITIYERQVKEWFLKPALNLAKYNNKNKGFIVLMVCLSYIEGVEQLRVGTSSHNRSKQYFVNSMNRIYQNRFNDYQLGEFYSQARCGLFHNGMVQGKIIINNNFNSSIEFVDNYDIRISPIKLLNDLFQDFENYIIELRQNETSQYNFNKMYSNI